MEKSQLAGLISPGGQDIQDFLKEYFVEVMYISAAEAWEKISHLSRAQLVVLDERENEYSSLRWMLGRTHPLPCIVFEAKDKFHFAEMAKTYGDCFDVHQLEDIGRILNSQLFAKLAI